MRARVAMLLLLAGCAKGSGVAADGPTGPDVDAFVAIDGELVDGHLVDGALIDAALIDAGHDAMVDAAPDAMVDAAHDAPAPDAMVDAAPMIDATVDAAPMIDAMVDAAPMIDAMVDAAPMVDAACTPVTTEILLNPAFDLEPMGTDWTEVRINPPNLPIITNDTGFPPQSAPYRAWMGGVEAPDNTVTDSLYQDIVVPANTTKLELTGFYWVGSDETTSTVKYDDANLDLIHTNGSPIEAVLALSNLDEPADWVAIDHVFTANLSGQTVRVRFTSTNDFSNATSFYFDTLSLKATHCP